MRIIRRVVCLVSLFGCLLASAAGAQVDREVATALGAAVPAAERGYMVDAAGLSRSGLRLASLEPIQPPAPAVRRLVIIGGLDGQAASQRAVTDFVRWWFHDPGAGALRSTWQVAVIPCALPDRCAGGVSASGSSPVFPPTDGFFDAKTDAESRFIWRWAAMQGPDLIVDVRAGARTAWRANALAQSRIAAASPADAASLVGAFGMGTPSGLAPVAALELTTGGALAAVLRPVLATAPGIEVSPLRRAIEARAAKSPLDVARSLAGRYPEAPSMSYIPALSWAGALRLAEITGEAKWRDKPLREMQPFLDGVKPAIAEPGSYRELTVTAMTITAMARGVRMGWLDASYRPVVDRAWRGLQAMVAADGTLLDVCTGTGAGALRQYYLDRSAISGTEDRGGAMALTAALEVYELQRPTR